MKTHYTAIYLSPHLDDVALSCGGQIYEKTKAGQAVLVATVMAGDPPPQLSGYAHSLHDRWQLQVDASAGRRAEDVEACRILGADAWHGPVPDCIYRTDHLNGEPLYLSDDDIFGDVHAAETALVRTVADQLAALPPADQIVAPLTVGHHVDHLIVRAAAEMVFGQRLFLYEDYPYAQEEGKRQGALAAETTPLTPTVIAVGDEALRIKIAAILAYHSQLSTFWTDQADLERQLFSYAREVGGERLWTLATPGHLRRE
jgi:LmbE family N-acetylglucosaminyl deacetylase